MAVPPAQPAEEKGPFFVREHLAVCCCRSLFVPLRGNDVDDAWADTVCYPEARTTLFPAHGEEASPLEVCLPHKPGYRPGIFPLAPKFSILQRSNCTSWWTGLR